MKIIDCNQGDTSWLVARCGVVTASEVDALITPEDKLRTGEGVRTYLYEKLTERVLGLTGSVPPTFSMDNGTAMEKEAIPWLEFTYNWEIERVGFCKSDDGKIGCSPDGLIGEDGGVELKCPKQTTHMRYLVEGVVPKQYRAQINMSLLVTGRKWWNFVSYSRYLPPLIVRVERNEVALSALKGALESFITELDQRTAEIKKMISGLHASKPEDQSK